jgi:basic amino acid/polyamine antiporter, APA family
MSTSPEPLDSSKPTARLGLWDAVSIIIGIVVGTSIFKIPDMICKNVSGTWEMVAVWALGGFLSLVGAMCYAELATTYPRSGGDYVYLTRAFGSWLGFLFGWAQLAVILTGSIGVMAFAFADYAIPLFQLPKNSAAILAMGAVCLLTIVNLLGVVVGKWMQNILSVCKIVGLAGILIAGVYVGGKLPLSVVSEDHFPGLGLAMIFVLYAYGGWNDAAFVAAEVRDPHRNLPKALIFGIGGIAVLYILINLAYVWGLGFEGVRNSGAPAGDLLKMAMGENAGRVMSALVVVSALGAINGLVFTGSRVYSTLGEDHRLFSMLAKWNHTLGAPIWSLLVQAIIAIGLILAVGTEAGRAGMDGTLFALAGKTMPWDDYYGGFNTLIAGTAPVFWLFFLLTGVSLFVLRFKDGDRPRPFRVPFYPITPLIFCGTSVFMLYSSLSYAKYLTLLGIVPLALGIPLYLWSGKSRNPEAIDSNR